MKPQGVAGLGIDSGMVIVAKMALPSSRFTAVNSWKTLSCVASGVSHYC